MSYIDRQLVAIAMVTAFLFMTCSPVIDVVATDVLSNINVGPYVNKIVFKVINDYNLQIQALQTGTIDIIHNSLKPDDIQIVDADPDISLLSTLRNGYGCITINCRDYPLNISAFRRAFAYAFDKSRVTTDIFYGLSQDHDSLVPYVSDWCIEDDMPYHYYLAEISKGAQILDAANFTIDPVTGYRNAPDGSPFEVVLEFPTGVEDIMGVIAQIGVNSLRTLDVNARVSSTAFYELMSRLDNHGDYDMICHAYNFHDDNVEWLAYYYWSEYADDPYLNPTNFKNSTYDSWRNQLLYGETYEEIYEAAAEMQMILQYNVPRLVVYENYMLQAYRNDTFTGHVEDINRYIAGTWTLKKIHKIDGTRGGTVSIALGEPDSFNVFLGTDVYSSTILDNLWPRLYLKGPNFEAIPYLAEELLVETHSENQDVQEGHTRFTVDIVTNATWTDGTPVTALDIAITFLYLSESRECGNPASARMGDLVTAYAPTTYRAVIEFNTESYWHICNFAYEYILPHHIFNDKGGIDASKWASWNPVFDPSEPYVTAGPFTLTDFEVGEFTEISANPSFWFFPSENSTITPSPTTSIPQFNFFLAIIAGGVGATVTLLIGSPIIIKRTPD